MANKRFTSIDNDYCIVFSKESKVEKCAGDVDIQSNSYNFTSLEDINDIVQSKTIDVIGVVLEVQSATRLQMKDGTMRDKRSLTIGDESHASIGVTLWGTVAQAHPYSSGQVIAMKNCRVSNYNGKSLNASSHADDIVIGSIKH